MKITISTSKGQKTLDFSQVAEKLKTGAKSAAHSSRVALTTVLEDVTETVGSLANKAKPEDYDEIQRQRAAKDKKREEYARKAAELKDLKAGL